MPPVLIGNSAWAPPHLPPSMLAQAVPSGNNVIVDSFQQVKFFLHWQPIYFWLTVAICMQQKVRWWEAGWAAGWACAVHGWVGLAGWHALMALARQ